MSIQRTPMTREGHTRLKDEVDRLKRVERPAITRAIKSPAHSEKTPRSIAMPPKNSIAVTR